MSQTYVHSPSGNLLHRTWTAALRPDEQPARFVDLYDNPVPSSLALCVCGWSKATTTRAEARTAAEAHRARPVDLPVFRIGKFSRKGPRNHNADAHASAVDDTTGLAAYAVADGIGDDPRAALAAQIAARVAVDAAVGGAAVAGLHAANIALHRLEPWDMGDTVMVVAVAMGEADRGGWDIAWVGDCRAYTHDHGELRQLTTDHTLGQQMRDSAHPPVRAAAPDYDHVVQTSIADLDPSTLGMVRTYGAHSRLLLTSDGVHKPLTHQVIARAASTFSDPRACAARLAAAVERAGGRDNVTAVVIDRTSTT